MSLHFFLLFFRPNFFQTSQFAFETRHILMEIGCNCLHLRYGTQVEGKGKLITLRLQNNYYHEMEKKPC